MATLKDILKKVRQLEIKSKQLTSNLFSGEYHSAFKGKGMSFKEVREYAAGDDIRFIDWNVSARFGTPFSKVFEEERELTVMLLVDVSASSLFGTVNASKKDIATEIAAVLTFSAINNGDKVGVIFYSNKIEKYIPAKKGRDHALFIIRELLSVSAYKKATGLNTALRYFTNINKHKSTAFILSDFIDTNYADALRVAASRHDIIGVKIWDKMDKDLPKMGMLRIEDAETGEQGWVDTSSAYVRHEYQKEFFAQTEYASRTFKRSGSDLLHVRTDEDYVKILQKFFLSRNKK
ncbi:DUF58 domain-containing protein [Flavisolibacter ginsenosidimutans]|uniref:DUF58 domain-containing protein n=1 Tax=Flavisolibacter ginsenosidimutans TaxID=661481 RepID=A0A5B8ULE7_9BACT|nr:DUF58 domain-containing protein [Flavisolibacter ginsenosidimutans]QEC57388.1 DUF58 domain-containing protein [Flavisolibacter ginsenosidimutans]